MPSCNSKRSITLSTLCNYSSTTHSMVDQGILLNRVRCPTSLLLPHLAMLQEGEANMATRADSRVNKL